MALIDCTECGSKISDQARSCPACGKPLSDKLSESEFLAWRKKRLNRLRIMMIICLPVGLYMQLPVVWGLCILGIIAASIKLGMIKEQS